VNHLDLVREATRIAHHAKSEELLFDDLFPDDATTEDVANLYLAAEEWRKTADLVAKVVASRLEPLVRNRAIETGGALIWYGETKKETCIDRDGFWKWAATVETDQLRKVFNEGDARKGSLPPSVRDTFFEKTPDGRVRLQYAPIEAIELAKQRRKREVLDRE
jgi:hypothetical protein